MQIHPLSVDAITGFLLPDRPDMTDVVDLAHKVRVYPEIDSTNDEAKRLIERGEAMDGMLLVANHQTAGRGRQGHDFYSPADTGLYVSLIRTAADVLEPAHLGKLTLAAAVATAEAIEETVGVGPKIKWVNDLYYNDRKVCGILTESFQWNKDRPRGVILGIGINCNTEVFPDELKDTAGSLTTGGIDFLDRNKLTVALWKRLQYWTEHLSDPLLLKEYRARDFLTGKTVSFERNGASYRGTVQGIDDDGKLIVRLLSALVSKSEAQTVVLDSGEVHITDW